MEAERFQSLELLILRSQPKVLLASNNESGNCGIQCLAILYNIITKIELIHIIYFDRPNVRWWLILVFMLYAPFPNFCRFSWEYLLNRTSIYYINQITSTVIRSNDHRSESALEIDNVYYLFITIRAMINDRPQVVWERRILTPILNRFHSW